MTFSLKNGFRKYSSAFEPRINKPHVTTNTKPIRFGTRNWFTMSAIECFRSPQPRSRKSVARIIAPNSEMKITWRVKMTGYAYGESRTKAHSVVFWNQMAKEVICRSGRYKCNQHSAGDHRHPQHQRD